jgi:hypothetical protein
LVRELLHRLLGIVGTFVQRVELDELGDKFIEELLCH